jgi:hypothetical protein
MRREEVTEALTRVLGDLARDEYTGQVTIVLHLRAGGIGRVELETRYTLSGIKDEKSSQ